MEFHQVLRYEEGGKHDNSVPSLDDAVETQQTSVSVPSDGIDGGYAPGEQKDDLVGESLQVSQQGKKCMNFHYQDLSKRSRDKKVYPPHTTHSFRTETESKIQLEYLKTNIFENYEVEREVEGEKSARLKVCVPSGHVEPNSETLEEEETDFRLPGIATNLDKKFEKSAKELRCKE